MKVIFYSSHCPKCRVLEQLMKQNNIDYQLIDDENIYLSIAEKNEISSMPFAEIDGEIIDTKKLQQYINDRKGDS